MGGLYWLPRPADFQKTLKAIKASPDGVPERLRRLQALAGHDLDLVQTANLDQCLQSCLAQAPDLPEGFLDVRLGLLSSSTVEPILPSVRVAALRRGLLARCYTGEYNQYRQELLDPGSGLRAFRPDVVLLALQESEAGLTLPLQATAQEAAQEVERRAEDWRRLWGLAKGLGATVIQQNLTTPSVRIFGSLDATLPAAPARLAAQLNEALALRAAEDGVLILDLEALASRGGKRDWCSLPLWFHAKQAVSPAAAPLYGEEIGRLLGAIRGRSRKCLVLDLDNTLWGGVIGDDGLEGIELGQGTGVGEAFQAFQHHLKRLKDRGVILAVCSKNEAANARLPFEKHPETVLRLDDFAAFVANWEDKASNLKAIAAQLNIGTDSLVFFDDNPAERGLVRQLLPEVAVCEVPEDPALFIPTLSDAGYFEAAAFTADDAQRAEQYRANAQRARAQAPGQDLTGYLKGLAMEMTVSPFDDVGRPRIAQLINKSNQFNLTTRRYTEAQVAEIQKDPKALTFQIRLQDVYGDNGMISVVILRAEERGGEPGFLIDTWLMSCRVLGRQVQEEALNAIAQQAQGRGGRFLWGEFIPTAKNGLVRDHYGKLGFTRVPAEGRELWVLPLAGFQPRATQIRTRILDARGAS